MLKLNIQMFGGRGASSSKGGPIKKYSLEYWKKQGITIRNKVPKGWRKVEGGTTAPRGYAWYNNNESLFGGKYKHMLVKE